MSERIITSELIKELVESLTDLNLSVKSRKRVIAHFRFVAFKLSKELTLDSLSSIGKLYNRDHATVLNGIKQFDILEHQYDFKIARKLYNKCYDILVPIPDKFKKLRKEIEVKTVFEKVIIDKRKLTPIQKLVSNLTPEQDKELTELITLRKKSWEWKSKDKITIYSGS